MKKLLSVTVNIGLCSRLRTAPACCCRCAQKPQAASCEREAGSELAACSLSVCDITFPNIYPWKFVHIWRSASLSPPDWRGYPVSASLLLTVCVRKCVCDRQGDWGGGRKEDIPYKAETWTSAWLVHRSCCGVWAHLSLLTDLELSVFVKGGGSFPPVQVPPHCKNTALHCPTCCSSQSHFTFLHCFHFSLHVQNVKRCTCAALKFLPLRSARWYSLHNCHRSDNLGVLSKFT